MTWCNVVTKKSSVRATLTMASTPGIFASIEGVDVGDDDALDENNDKTGEAAGEDACEEGGEPCDMGDGENGGEVAHQVAGGDGGEDDDGEREEGNVAQSVLPEGSAGKLALTGVCAYIFKKSESRDATEQRKAIFSALIAAYPTLDDLLSNRDECKLLLCDVYKYPRDLFRITMNPRYTKDLDQRRSVFLQHNPALSMGDIQGNSPAYREALAARKKKDRQINEGWTTIVRLFGKSVRSAARAAARAAGGSDSALAAAGEESSDFDDDDDEAEAAESAGPAVGANTLNSKEPAKRRRTGGRRKSGSNIAASAASTGHQASSITGAQPTPGAAPSTVLSTIQGVKSAFQRYFDAVQIDEAAASSSSSSCAAPQHSCLS